MKMTKIYLLKKKKKVTNKTNLENAMENILKYKASIT